MSIKNRWNSHLKKVVRSTKNGTYLLDYEYNIVVQQQIRTSKQVQRHNTVSKILGNLSDIEEIVQPSRNKTNKKEEVNEQTDIIDFDVDFPMFTPDSIFLDDYLD